MATGIQFITKETVEAALAEFFRLGRQEFLRKYGFGRARDYHVQDPLTGA